MEASLNNEATVRMNNLLAARSCGWGNATSAAFVLPLCHMSHSHSLLRGNVRAPWQIFRTSRAMMSSWCCWSPWQRAANDVDEAQAVDITLAQGDMSLHHIKILHGSPPNRSNGRRMGYAIRYVAPYVKQRGDMNSATLVRGEDRYGYFAKDPVPTRDMDPDIVAFVDRRYGGKPLGVAATQTGSE